VSDTGGEAVGTYNSPFGPHRREKNTSYRPSYRLQRKYNCGSRGGDHPSDTLEGRKCIPPLAKEKALVWIFLLFSIFYFTFPHCATIEPIQRLRLGQDLVVEKGGGWLEPAGSPSGWWGGGGMGGGVAWAGEVVETEEGEGHELRAVEEVLELLQSRGPLGEGAGGGQGVSCYGL